MHWTEALLTVLLAGISESIGQSVVLFANRVKPARFVLSLLVNAFLIAFGYAFLVVSTWATFLFVPNPQPAFSVLAIAIALSYAPLLISFLSALPYAGTALLWILRIWQLLAMVSAVASAAKIPYFSSAAHVALGWVLLLLAQRTLGKPITALGVRLIDAAAGMRIVREKVAVRRVAHHLTREAPPLPDQTPHEVHKRKRGRALLTGIILTFVIVAVIIVALTPLRDAIAGPYLNGVFWRVGLNLLWVALVAVVVAAFLAPIETLGWWAGWYGDQIDPEHPLAEPHPAKTSAAEPRRFIVYLDGISQSSSEYTPDIETFLNALEPELPADVRLIRGIMAYSVVNPALDEDPIYARFWKVVEGLRLTARTAILGMFINLRNVLIVAVSADDRYGPLYNLGIAQVIYNALLQYGYRLRSGTPITLIGYSGGGQMAAESAPLLKGVLRAPIDIISLGGVMTGTCPFLRIDSVHHFVGTKDVIEPVGRIMFSSRWRIAFRSNWNRALKRGTITLHSLGPVGHQVPGGMLDPDFTLPDGRTALRQTLDGINGILSAPQTVPHTLRS